jgi:hypothetical protein
MVSLNTNVGEDFWITTIKAQMKSDEMYIEAMWGTIQGIIPMMKDESIDADYRFVLEQRIKTWHNLMLNAQTHHANLKMKLNTLLVK